MDRNKKLVLIFVGCATIVAIVVVVIVATLKGDPEPTIPEITRTTDQDTGDEIISVEGKEPEFQPRQEPTVFGGAKMTDQTVMTSVQYQLVVRAVTEYAMAHVGDKVTAVKFLPDTVKTTASTSAGIPYRYTVQVKTEEPVTILAVTINLIGLDRVRVIITNTEHPEAGTFDSDILPYNDEEDFDSGV